jgi:Mycothiol maleylpyruvate isomerase N-terminal domain
VSDVDRAGSLNRAATIDALAEAYGNVTVTALGLSEAELMLPSRCAGWAVGDVLFHELLDARRALRTFATPVTGLVDVDDVSYWKAFAPPRKDGGLEVAGEAAEAAAAHAKYVRVAASAYPAGALVRDWRETAGAACRAARACLHDLVATQGHVLRTADFVATLVVEAAIHLLDMTVELASAPAPSPASLGLVRRVLDGLAGHAVPIAWDDTTYALKGTGRAPLTDEERRALGPAADHFPLFG